MKKLYTLLLMTLVFATAFAETVTITCSDLYTAAGNSVATATQGTFTFTSDKSNGQTAPKFLESYGDFRLYAKGKYKITTTGPAMTKIVFNLSEQGLTRLAPITASTGMIEAQASGDETVTWTGSANEVEFTVGDNSNYGSDGDTKAGQLDFLSIVITTGEEDEDALVAPTITPAGGTFEAEETVTVTITDNNEGTTLKYSVDDAAEIWNDYTAPFTITESTTVRAKAVNGDKESPIASAVFTFKPGKTQVTTIADLNALADGTEFKYNGNAMVLGKNGGQLFLVDTDNSAGTLLYLSNAWTADEFAYGANIAAGWTGTKNSRYSLPNITPAGVTVDGTTSVSPITGSAATITTDNFAVLQVLKNVELGEYSNNNFTITIGEDEIAGRDALKLFTESYPEDLTKAYDVTGFVGGTYTSNGTTTVQFYPVKIEEHKEAVVLEDIEITLTPDQGRYDEPQNVKVTVANTVAPYTVTYSIDNGDAVAYDDEAGIAIEKSCTLKVTVTEELIDGADEPRGAIKVATYDINEGTTVTTLAEAKALALGTEFTFDGTIHYTYRGKIGRGTFTYVADETGGFVVYGATPDAEPGTVIKSGWSAIRSNLGIQTFKNFEADGTTTVEPKEFAVNAVTVDDRYTYAILKNVTIKDVDGSNFVIADAEGNELAATNAFSTVVTLPEDLEKAYDITGLIEVNGDAAFLRPVKFEEVSDEPIDEGVNTIAKYLALEDDAEFTFTGEAYVTYADANDKRYLYIADETGAALIYDKNLDANLPQGTVIAKGWSGKKTNYNGLYEITEVANLAAKEGAELETVEPVTINVTDVVTDKQNTYSVLEGVTIKDINGRNFTIADADGNEVAGYNQFNKTISLSDISATATYDITGVVSVHDAAQFIPTAIEKVGGDDPEVIEIEDLADIAELEDGDEFKFVGTAYVNYQNGKYLYLQQDFLDEDGDWDYSSVGLLYGDTDLSYELGDIIPTGWTGKKKTYKGLIEVVDFNIEAATEQIENVAADTAPFDYEGYLDELTVAEMNYKIYIADATISDIKNKDFSITADGVTLAGHNQFDIELPTDLDKTYNFQAMVSVFNDEISLYPITEFEVATTYLSDIPYKKEVGDNVIITDDLYVVYADEASKTIYATDNFYVLWFYPTWVALKFDSAEAFQAAAAADALAGVEGTVKDLLNLEVTVTNEPEAIEAEDELTIFSYDLSDEYGLMGAYGNEIAAVSGYYTTVDGAEKFVASETSNEPAVDLDFTYSTDTWELNNGYETMSILKLKEAWEPDEDDEDLAPARVKANKVVPGSKKQHSEAIGKKQAARREAARRAQEFGDDYYTNYVIMPILSQKTTGVKAIETGKQVAAVEYINTLGQRSDRAFDGVNIRVTTYTDGTTSTVKVVK